MRVDPVHEWLGLALYELNDFSVIVRYPAHIPLEASDTVQALQAVETIKSKILKIINA